jgi:hypothetical protein
VFGSVSSFRDTKMTRLRWLKVVGLYEDLEARRCRANRRAAKRIEMYDIQELSIVVET